MSRTEEILSQAHRRVLETAGWLSIMLAARRGLTRRDIRRASAALREAAEYLDGLS